MSLLLVTLILAAEPVSDPRGFSFQPPEGFSAFPGFKPTGNKLYAFGKNLGSLQAITLTLDAIEGPVTPGQPSVACGKLMQIDRTVGAPMTERWNGTELTGARMVMTHAFGEVVVLCLDVPVQPSGVTLMVSGKPENEPALEEAFTQTLASISGPKEQPSLPLVWVAAPLSVIALLVFLRSVRGSASRSSR